MKRTVSVAVLAASSMCTMMAQEATKAPARSALRGYEVSGVVRHAVTGEPLPKTKVTLTPVKDDAGDEDTVQRFQRGGGGPPGAGFAAGGGGGGFGGPGGQRRGDTQATERAPATIPVTLEATTDGNGRFVIASVPAGKYQMAAQKRNFPRQLLDRHGTFSTAVIVGSGKDSKNIAFRIYPESNINGRITDDFGDPVRNAQVMLFYRSADTGEESVRRRSGTATDQQGEYHFSHLTPGTYYVVVSAQPWYMMYARMMPQSQDPNGAKQDGDANLDVAFPMTYYANSTEESDATPINLKSGEHFVADMLLNTVQQMHIKIANIDPAVPFQPMVTATAFGQPVFVNPMINRNQQGMTIGVAPGNYDVNFRSFNRDGPPTPGRKQILDAHSDAEVDFTKASDAAPVTGTVKFEGAGENTPRGQLIFRKKDTNETVVGRVTGDGEVQNAQLFPGKYAVSASFSPWLMKSFSATGARVIGRTMEVTGTEPINVLVTMSRAVGRVEGTVKGSDAEAGVAGAMVVLVPEDVVNDQPLFRRYQSDSDGSFSFTNVVPGKYTVIALQKGWDLEWGKPDVLKDYLAGGEVIEVPPGGKMKVTAKIQ